MDFSKKKFTNIDEEVMTIAPLLSKKNVANVSFSETGGVHFIKNSMITLSILYLIILFQMKNAYENQLDKERI